MANALARLGRFSFRRRRLVVGLWALLVVAVGVGAATLSGPTTDSFSIPGTESQDAMDLLEDRLPESGTGNASARIVFTTDDGSLADPANQASINEAIAQIAEQPNVATAHSPFATGTVSADGQTATATVSYEVAATEVTEHDRELLNEALEPVGAELGVAVGGNAAAETPSGGGAAEAIGILIAAVVLAITFGSLVAAGLPLLTAVVGVLLGLLSIQIATGFFDLSGTTSTLALMLGLAVGIDYALFIISRYRHELLTTRNTDRAIGTATGTAGSAVVFAGLTVVIALVALLVVGIPFLAAMGIAAAGTVLLAVAIALTLVPAMLGFAGLKILGRKGFAAHDTEDEPGGTVPLGERWASLVIRHRWIVAAVGIAVLVVAALPALDMRLGLPNDGTAEEGTPARLAYDQVSEGFGPGMNGPLLVAVDLTNVGDPAATAARIHDDLGDIDGIASVAPPTVIEEAFLATISVIPTTGPSDAATTDLVGDIRDHADEWGEQTGAQVSVTGETAVAIDVSDKLFDSLIPYLAVIVGLAFALLTLVFRSLLVPLKATLGYLLSVLAAFGGVVAVFQWGWLKDLIGLHNTGPVLSFLPILLIGILFGLAMDYQVFLVSRMREDFTHGAGPDEAILGGFRHGARVVSAAAVIMIAVFAGFVLEDDATVKSIGFALALGVALDAFIVRMTIVPAVMAILGRSAWSLPTWLDKTLPNIDVEGATLDDGHMSGPDEPTPSEDLLVGAGR